LPRKVLWGFLGARQTVSYPPSSPTINE